MVKPNSGYALGLLLFFCLILAACTVQNQEPAMLRQDVPSLSKGQQVAEIGKKIWSIFQDKKGNYWFGSDGDGLFRYDGKQLIQFTDKDGLGDNQIRVIQEDVVGNLWLVTATGITQFDGQTFRIKTGRESFQFGLDIKMKHAWGLSSDDLWFQAGMGPYRYDGENVVYLELPKNKFGDEFQAKYPNVTFSSYDIYRVFKDNKGHIWFGTAAAGVCRYDGKSFTWISENGLADSPVRSIFQDKSGNYWLGNSGQGLYYYDGKEVRNFREEKGIGNIKGRSADAPVSYMSIIEDEATGIWIATYDAGLWRLEGEKLTNYTIEDGLGTNAIMVVFKDKKGDLWIGTDGAGLRKFNGQTFSKFELK